MKMEITTSETSSYGGKQVLRVDDTMDYGPADLVVTPNGAWLAATIAITMIDEPGFAPDSVAAFCAAWPDGPQPKKKQ